MNERINSLLEEKNHIPNTSSKDRENYYLIQINEKRLISANQ